MSDSDRRRHARHALSVRAWVDAGAVRLLGNVIDVSAGGLLLELPPELPPPQLGTHGRATVEKDGIIVQRGARVVRARLSGRDRGAPLLKACAFVFDDGDDDAERRLQALLAAG